MYQLPSLQQQMAALRIAELHAEAAHARQVKEARAASRATRGPSRVARTLATIREVVAAAVRGSVSRVASRPHAATPVVDWTTRPCP